MNVGSNAPTPQVGVDSDVVGDRNSLVLIGLTAVGLACLIFAVMRLLVTLQTGRLTPWWGNAAGVVAIAALYFWYRSSPQARSSGAAQGTALVATLALLLPIAYGMTSTIWWLSLVGFAMVLLGRRQEARVWGVAIPLLVVAAVIAEPHVQVRGAAGERFIEAALAKVVFVAILLGMAAAFRRVAERRATALHDSEERYRMLFQRVPVGVVHYDRDLRITDCNRPFEVIMGGGQERLTGYDLSSLPDPRPVPALRETLSGEPCSYDGPYRLPSAAGDAAVSLRTVPLLGADGEIAGALGLLEDVTDRKRMEAEIRRARDELEERVRERTEELRRRTRALTVMTRCNEALARASDELTLLSEVCRFIGEDGIDRFVWVELSDGREPAVPRLAARHGNGRGLLGQAPVGEGLLTPVALALRASAVQVTRAHVGDADLAPWRDELLRVGFASAVAVPLRADGNTLGVLGVLERDPGAFDAAETELLQELADDIAFGLVALRTRAAREVAERALRESEERYRLLFERNLAGVFRLTADGRVVDCNEACARIFGYASRAEALGTPVSTLLEPSEESDAAHERLLREGHLLNHEQSYRRKDGKTIWVIENLSRSGDLIDGTMIDVTERRLLEDQFRQSQQMEAVGRLAGGVAHDFNNLLSVIISYSGFALDALPASDPVRADLEEVKQAGERAAALTRQLLAFSRKQVIAPQVLSLNQVVGDLAGMLRRLLREDIHFVIKLAEQLGSVSADAGQMEQVIMNLVVNARDAMPNGGTLIVETANVELDEEYVAEHLGAQPGRYVLLAVTDTGSGMEATVREHIFEPFFTTKMVGRGTGLGLATVYGVVKQIGGYIWVYSEPGQGTCFKIYLPRLDAAATQARRGQVSEVARGSETILLAEDDDAVRRVAERILVGAGYRVLTAANGQEAVGLMERHGREVDLLVTDVVMPQMGGHDLAEHLARLRPELKVIYVSGYTDDAIAHHGVLEPGTHLVAKPFTAVALTQKVREVLDAGSERGK
ncbi:MAG: PAS domain S-box protein [bacterium]